MVKFNWNLIRYEIIRFRTINKAQILSLNQTLLDKHIYGALIHLTWFLSAQIWKSYSRERERGPNLEREKGQHCRFCKEIGESSGLTQGLAIVEELELLGE